MLSGIIRKWYLKLILNTKVWHYTNIFRTAKIGRNCVIGSYVEIGDKVEIGDRCKIECRAFIPKGVKIGNEVFIGPSVTFVNDKYPKAVGEWSVKETIVEDGASVGANCTILCGVKIGRESMIGAGSVVCKDVKAGYTVVGYSARSIK